jgi:hypothetical protein
MSQPGRALSPATIPPPAQPSGKPYTPSWVVVLLTLGVFATTVWAILTIGSFSEPSATGRTKLTIQFWAVDSVVGLVLCVAGVVGLVQRASWGRRVAWAASVALVLSFAGTLLGLPALVGLFFSRNQSRP